MARLLSAGRSSAVRLLLAIVGFAVLTGEFARGQKADDAEAHQARRARAMELFEDHKHLEALPLLEAVVLDDPKDYVAGAAGIRARDKVRHRHGRRAEKNKASRRAIIIHLKAERPLSNLGQVMLEGLPPDGSLNVAFSPKKDVDKAMHEGEAAFARREFAKALAAYELAYQLDPKLYPAALFSGDVFFVQGKHEQAAKWFARAVAIDPDQATAHRYWGDALMKSGKMAEARC